MSLFTLFMLQYNYHQFQTTSIAKNKANNENNEWKQTGLSVTHWKYPLLSAFKLVYTPNKYKLNLIIEIISSL